MPVQTTYPGVYVEEVPSGVRTIIGVATSITAFVVRARRGPVNTPVTINSYGDFERTFGGLWLEGPMSYSVRDFYTNGGSQGVIVRLFHPTFASDDERLDALAAATNVANAVAGATVPIAVTAATNEATKAENTGVPVRNAAAQTVLAAITAAAAAADATVASVKAAATATVPQAAPFTRARFSVPTAGSALLLEARNEGTWGNALRIRTDHDVKGGDATLYNLSVKDLGTGEVEVFRNVSNATGATRRIDKVLELESRLLRATGTPVTDHPTASATPAVGADPFGAASSIGVSTPASDGVVPDDNDYLGSEAAKTGIHALAGADLFNLLVLPPRHYGPSSTTEISQLVWAAAATLCQKRRAMLLIDAPGTWRTKDQVKTGLAAPGNVIDRNAALYFPRLRQANPLRDGQIEELAPSGAVAGIMARTDTERGVWKAPAGLEATLRGVAGLSVALTDGENGELNPLGVNCLRTMPAAGQIVWGARTTRGADRLADEWKYVPVRRTALFIEETLFRALHWVVFEPNDEPLWAQIRLNVGAFMHGLFRQGAFQGASPRDAYFVKCDSETTPRADVDRGVVNVLVGFAPLKPAEFVIIRLQQIAGQLAI
jgi:phage tail sheath protein FI